MDGGPDSVKPFTKEHLQNVIAMVVNLEQIENVSAVVRLLA